MPNLESLPPWAGRLESPPVDQRTAVRPELLLSSIPELDPNHEHCSIVEQGDDQNSLSVNSDSLDVVIGQWIARPRADLDLDPAGPAQAVGVHREPVAGSDHGPGRLNLVVVALAAIATGVGFGYLYALLIG